MSRTTSSDRLRRILAIVPWVASQDGPTVDEICERFQIERRDLLADLDVVFMVGIPPYTPDTLVDVIVEDDRVWIRLGDYFRRPLRLSPAEGLSLLAAAEAVAGAAGTDPGDGPLARGLAKLAAALGVQLGESGELEVSLGVAPREHLDLLREAVERRRQVELDYYSYGRDEHSVRVVDPQRVTARDGAWYLLGWCHRAGDERVFRVDRIASATLLDTTFEPRDASNPELGYREAPGDLRVVLRLAPSARWVVDHHPVVAVEPQRDGALLATLAVAELPWLVRLLVRLGPEATIVSVEAGTAGTERTDIVDVEGVRAAVAEAVGRIRARYRNGGSPAVTSST